MEKYKKINQASILGIIGNLFLLIIKGIIGILFFNNSIVTTESFPPPTGTNVVSVNEIFIFSQDLSLSQTISIKSSTFSLIPLR